MQNVPLYFDFRQLVAGNGFLAEIRMRGRATCVEEFGSTWVHGVNPGGLADNGDDLASAYANFRLGVIGVLFDLAKRADDLDQFHQAALTFLRETDDESVAEWEAARQTIREGDRPETGLDRVETRDIAPDLRVNVLVDERRPPSPAVNLLPESQLGLAA